MLITCSLNNLGAKALVTGSINVASAMDLKNCQPFFNLILDYKILDLYVFYVVGSLVVFGVK